MSVRPVGLFQIAVALFTAPRSEILRQLGRIPANFEQLARSQLRKRPPQQDRRTLVNGKILEV
jgi:hypothetical protein